MRTKKLKPEIDLKELRNQIIKLHADGKKIISHYRGLDKYYSDWEDRLYEIEKKIQRAETELGIPLEQIMEPNVLEDLLNG